MTATDIGRYWERCPAGHAYDRRDNPECPICALERRIGRLEDRS